MPVTLKATASANDANSYATVAEADAYFEARINAGKWYATNEKEQALITATADIDRMLRFRGLKASSAQALEWPRDGLLDEEGNAIASGVVPEFVKRATYERALALVTAPVFAGPSGLDSIESITKGPFTLRPRSRSRGIGDAVIDYLRPYLAARNRLEMG